VGRRDRQEMRCIKENEAPLTNFEQQTTADRETDGDKLRRPSRIRNKNPDSSKLPNTCDNVDNKKVVVSALSKTKKILDIISIEKTFI
jgi:hypothetical protein